VIAIIGQTDEGCQISELLRQAGAIYDLQAACSMGDVEGVRNILLADKDAIPSVPSPKVLLTGLVFVGRFGTISSRLEILRLLLEHVFRPDNLCIQGIIDSCKESNLTEFIEPLSLFLNNEP
jgi:hypothetical protein